MTPQQLEALVGELDRLLAKLPVSDSADTNSGKQSTAARKRIEEFEVRVNQLVISLDPVRRPKAVFDPAHPAQIGRFVALALLAQPRVSLGVVDHRFYGSGIYALYYKGNSPFYKPLSKKEHPIYVGKADPKDTNAATPKAQGMGLYGRLADHSKSVTKASATLKVEEFECRYLVVQSGWQTAAEDYLIDLFKPIWNSETKKVFGIGKHGDKAETRGNKRSPWDTLHPGRTWAGHEKLVDQKSKETIGDELKEHFAQHPIFQSVDKIIQQFMDEMRQS